jgi:hypothetical protein
MGIRWLATVPPVAVGLLIAGGGLTPTGLDQPITSMHTALSELPIAEAHSERLYLASTLIIFGLGALGLSFVAIATLGRGTRGSTPAVWATAVGVIACFCGALANVLVGPDLAGAARANTTQQAAARILVSINTASIAYALLGAYLAGLAVASILIALALWRSQRIPRWLAVAFPISMLAAGAAPPGLRNVLLSIPLAIVMLLLARRIWRGPDQPPRPWDLASPA